MPTGIACFLHQTDFDTISRGQMKRVLELPDQAVSNCSQAIKLNPAYLKALLRRAEIYEETDKLGKLRFANLCFMIARDCFESFELTWVFMSR